MKRIFTIIFMSISLLISVVAQNDSAKAETQATPAATDLPRVYTFHISEEINSRTWLYTQKAMREAIEFDADLVVLQLNTYGGEVVYADSIRTALLRSPLPVVAYIDKNAASAGALISIACRRIYMAPGSSIGAATVVSGVDGAAMPDKYQSYMRATMRATAEAHGRDSLGRWYRDPLIAEAMVDERISIEGIVDSGKILTFTTEEAIRHRYCESKAEDLDVVLSCEGISPDRCTISEFRPSLFDKIKGTIMGTALRSILIMLIIGGIYFELQSPGIGFPLITSIVAALLYFAPLYIDGVAANWEILVFVAGIVLVVVELFLFPGFGVAGVLGILCILFGLGSSMLDNEGFNFTPIHIPDLNEALLTLFLGLILSSFAVLWLTHKIGSRGIFRRLALQKEQTESEGYIGVPTQFASLVGAEGVTHTDLRPSGKVLIDGRNYDAVSFYGGFIARGRAVVVRKYEATQLYVVEKEEKKEE